MSAQEARESRRKVNLPGVRSGLFPECQLRLSETYLFRNPDLFIPGLPIAPALFDRFAPNVQLGYGPEDLKRAFEYFYPKLDPNVSLLDVAAAFHYVKRAGKGTGKNKSSAKSLSSLPRLRDHVDDRGLSVAHNLDGFVQRRAELIRLGDRAEAVQAQRASDRRQVRRWIFDANATSLILHGSLPPASHSFLMILIVVIRAIVENNDEQRNLILRRRS